MAQKTYKEVRQQKLDELLNDYQKNMVSYRRALTSNKPESVKVEFDKLDKNIDAVKRNNASTNILLNDEIKKMESNVDLPKSKERSKHLRKLLADRKHALSYTDQRIKEDIENDRWINYKLTFFIVTILGLSLLTLFFLRKLYKKQKISVAPPVKE